MVPLLEGDYDDSEYDDDDVDDDRDVVDYLKLREGGSTDKPLFGR